MKYRATLLAGALIAILVAQPAAAQEGGYAFVRQWGGEGTAEGQFNFPRAIAIGPDGNLYVADSENHRIQVFGTDGSFIRAWGSYGSEAGQFDVPQGIAVDAWGFVYVSDRNNNRIQKFTTDGEFVTMWGSEGIGAGQFIEPRNLAVGPGGNIYVADSWNHRIQVFDPDGRLVITWGGRGTEPGRFNYATGVTVDSEGFVYVCDADNQRIQKFTPDGIPVTTWGEEGSGPGQFSRPYSISAGPDGYIYVVDEWNHRIQKFTPDGGFVTMWGSEGDGPGQFYLPHGVAIDTDGFVYVVDEWNHRIQVFRPEGEAEGALPPTPEPLTPTPEPFTVTLTEPPTRPPTVAPVPGTDYFEDFQDNVADGWTLGPTWFILQEQGGNYILVGFGPDLSLLSEMAWVDFEMQCRLNIRDGEPLVIFRGAPENRYVLYLSENSTQLLHIEDSTPSLLSAGEPVPRDTWFTLDIIVVGQTVQILVDGRLYIDSIDPAAPPEGVVGFRGPTVGEVWVDDVAVGPVE